ncbi:MAG: hypothetical protein FWF28_08480, partial [Micrococcales bacterium]|nr:hypothetical protein [Micrococcales bacterium]
MEMVGLVPGWVRGSGRDQAGLPLPDEEPRQAVACPTKDLDVAGVGSAPVAAAGAVGSAQAMIGVAPELDGRCARPLEPDGVAVAQSPSSDPIGRLVAAAALADRLAIAVAAFRDELVATAYREGAAAYAARLPQMTSAQRREWGARGMLAELACAL